MSTETEKVKVRQSSVYIGAILEIENQEIPLIPSTPINRIKEEGFELIYPEDAKRISVNPGKVVDDIGAEVTGKEFNISQKITDANIPMLSPMADKVLKGKLTFEKIHLKIPNETDRGNAVTVINNLVAGTIQGEDLTKKNITTKALKEVQKKEATTAQIEQIQKGQTAQTFSLSLTLPTGKDAMSIAGITVKSLYLGITNETGEGEYGNDLFNLEKRRKQALKDAKEGEEEANAKAALEKAKAAKKVADDTVKEAEAALKVANDDDKTAATDTVTKAKEAQTAAGETVKKAQAVVDAINAESAAKVDKVKAIAALQAEKTEDTSATK